jgi:hypothetical protein
MRPSRRRAPIVLPLLVLSLLLRWGLGWQEHQLAADQRRDHATVVAIERGDDWAQALRQACTDTGGQWLATPAIDPWVALGHARCVGGRAIPLASPVGSVSATPTPAPPGATP